MKNPCKFFFSCVKDERFPFGIPHASPWKILVGFFLKDVQLLKRYDKITLRVKLVQEW